MNWETIMCFGDSITIGSRSMLAYPEYCGHFLSTETKKKWNVVNHAKAGFTTIDLVRSINNNFFNLKSFKPEIATIMIGTNDLKSNTSISDFQIAYTQVIIKARLIVGSSNIILIKIPKLLEGVMLPYKIEMNERIEEFNHLIQDIGNKESLIVEKMNSNCSDFYDGVHLNDIGSKNWGKQLADVITNMRYSKELNNAKGIVATK
ncbi:SGNH/GDSL hydrolase family protein [Aquimarina algiphila]|uniref:SGNH/GDSL hydrolase family protein n=1 Tax=Aquimarina algiphila TaxID=2047982 RepID=UPI0023303C0B|nr:SGNH/GDSL hydrolase family protein [Aquimarina algiphila]